MCLRRKTKFFKKSQDEKCLTFKLCIKVMHCETRRLILDVEEKHFVRFSANNKVCVSVQLYNTRAG